MDNVVPTDAEERKRSLAFLVDTDMTTYPGFLNAIVQHAKPGKVRSLPTGLVRVTGPNGTRSAIIRVTARGGKMIPRLISFAPASVAFKALSDTHLRLEQALGRWQPTWPLFNY